MEDAEFFDLLYQQWSRTTGAEKMFWMSEEDEGYYAQGPGTFNIWAVDQEQNKAPVAQGLEESDADFIAGVHGCVADLIRRLHTALDEADRLDIEKDELIGRVADLELEAIDHRGIVTDLTDRISTSQDAAREATDYADEMVGVVADLQFQLDEVGR